MNKSIALVVAGVVLVGAVAAYVVLGKDDTTDSNDSAANTSQSNNSNRNTSSNFEAIKDEKLDGELVSSFPADEVTLYPGEVTSSLGQMDSTGERAEWNVAITTSDSFEIVDAAIREAFEADMWSIANEDKSLRGGTQMTARSNKYTASITYDQVGDSVFINYGVSQR